MQQAHPEKFKVEVVGTPDPADTHYFVLDLVRDPEARVAVAKLINNYEHIGKPAKADECRKALRDSTPAMVAAIAMRTETQKPKRR